MAEASVSAAEADAERREALRKAGQDYFEAILAKAAAGRDPFVAEPPARRKPADVESLDPDMETVGLVLKGTQLYILGALFFAATTLRLVFASSAVKPLQTPAIQSFLHLLPSTIGLWAVTDVGPLTPANLKASLVQIVLAGIQVGSLFAALVHGSVFLVIPWVTLIPQLITFEREFLYGTSSPATPRLVLLAFGVSGGAVALMSGLRSPLDALFFLLVWASAQGLQVAWTHAKKQADSVSLIPGRLLGIAGDSLTAWVRSQIAEEGSVPPATIEFYRNAIPAVPLLLMGFLCLEGSELVQHELSVPAVSMILMSCGAWATAVCTHLLLQANGMPRAHIARLQGLASLSSLVSAIFLNGVPSAALLISASLAVVGGACENLLAHGGLQLGP